MFISKYLIHFYIFEHRVVIVIVFGIAQIGKSWYFVPTQTNKKQKDVPLKRIVRQDFHLRDQALTKLFTTFLKLTVEQLLSERFG